jgi:hypothetical protein
MANTLHSARPKIDLDRGVITRITHAGEVSSYVDVPGVYFDGQGEPVTDDAAVRAGFDLERDRLEMRKLERLAKAKAEIDVLWATELDAMKEEEPLPPLPLQQTASPSNPDEGWQTLADPLK